MNTVVVGNGVIIDKANLIDSFDNVVRINWLRHLEDSKHRGKKVDIWALTGTKKNIVKGMHTFKLQTVWYFHEQLGNIDQKFIDQHRYQLNANPTTGFLAIMMAIKTFGECAIIGFDFFENDKLHYWDDDRTKEQIVSGHNPKEEKSVLENIYQNEIIIL